MKRHVLAVLERHQEIQKHSKCAIFGQNGQHNFFKTKLNSVALVRERTIPTEWPPPVGEVSANFCG